MDNFLQFIQNLTTRFKDLSATNKAIALGLAAAFVASLLTMVIWIQSPDHQLLFANLSPEDASAVVEELKTRNIEYELSNNGKNIRVPAAVVHETRINLASKGLPEGNEVGLELFEDTPLGMTEFIQKLNFQRALQGELSRTIKSLDAVNQARVHLVIPKGEIFLKDKPEGKASVMLKIRSGKSLTEHQIQGIVHLVSSSVEDLPANNVVLVDFNGNLLSGQKGASSESALFTASNYKYKRKVEQELEASIIGMFEEALGPEKVIAKVSAEINFDKVERTEEIFDPDSQVVRSEQNSNESSVGSSPTGGVPGVQSLVPGGQGGQTTGGNPAQKSKEKQTFNYEINKVIKHVTETSGEIKRLSVSVLVDGLLQGDPPEYKPRSSEEMAKFLEIIKTAVGFNEKRGDKIQLENVKFDKSQELKRAEELATEERWDMIITGAKILGAVILLLIFILKILMPMVRWVSTSVEVVPEEEPLPSHEELEAEEEKKRIQRANKEMTDMRQSVNEFVEADPKYAAGIIRKWLKDRS